MTTQSKKILVGRVVRAALLGATVVAMMPTAVGCLDRPVAPASPRTSNTLTDQVRVSAVDKIDVLFMIDNSVSMADKQQVLAEAVPDLVNRLVKPQCVAPGPDGKPAPVPADASGNCPAGSAPEFSPIKDIHIGVVTSSMGAHGSDYCVSIDPAKPGQDRTSNFTQDDKARLISRGPRTDPNNVSFPQVATYESLGFLAWDPDQKLKPPGEGDAAKLVDNVTSLVKGTDQIGCGYEASLEAWYRFLIDPKPPASITANPGGANGPPTVEGVDEVLLKQRADFLRPDSLVAVINLSDENDCSIIDGQLPATVCEDPELDADGNPTGVCKQQAGWPRGYAEGNFQGWQADAQGRVTGTPFPVNHLSAQQKVGGGTFRLKSGKAVCADDPYSPGCSTCYLDGSGECTQLDDTTDAPNVRCWDQKRRFGVSMLYPLRRYVDGLSQQKVYDRDGFLVPNPLFDDLPFKAAKKAGSPLKRPKFEARDPRLVFFATIVGVPWQDIARDPADLTKGYKPAQPTAEESEGVSWDMILGAPFAIDKADRKDPTDPLMIETTNPRSGVHPITKEEIGGVGKWNSVNGHEWKPGTADLQYACIFNLPQSRSCEGVQGACDCTTAAQTQENPLCEAPGADGKGSGTSTTTQYRAKAFPGTRFLQVAKDFGQNSIVASICTPNLTNPAAADYGYRPAVSAIIDRLKTQLTGRCLPRQLAPNPDGSTPCLIIDAQYKKDPSNDPNDVAQCKSCDRQARKKLDPEVAKVLTGDVLSYECLCEVTQLAGPDLTQCRTEKDLPSLASGNGGWCYVDPGAVDPKAPDAQTLKDQAAAIVEKCPANEKRTIRFVSASTENTTLFITCLGAASGTVIEAPSGQPQQ